MSDRLLAALRTAIREVYEQGMDPPEAAAYVRDVLKLDAGFAIEEEARTVNPEGLDGETLAKALYEVMSSGNADRYADTYPSTEWADIGEGAASAWIEDAIDILRRLSTPQEVRLRSEGTDRLAPLVIESGWLARSPSEAGIDVDAAYDRRERTADALAVHVGSMRAHDIVDDIIDAYEGRARLAHPDRRDRGAE